VASYTYDRLPPEEQAALPDAATLTAALTSSAPDDPDPDAGFQERS